MWNNIKEMTTKNKILICGAAGILIVILVLAAAAGRKKAPAADNESAVGNNALTVPAALDNTTENAADDAAALTNASAAETDNGSETAAQEADPAAITLQELGVLDPSGTAARLGSRIAVTQTEDFVLTRRYVNKGTFHGNIYKERNIRLTSDQYDCTVIMTETEGLAEADAAQVNQAMIEAEEKKGKLTAQSSFELNGQTWEYEQFEGEVSSIRCTRIDGDKFELYYCIFAGKQKADPALVQRWMQNVHFLSEDLPTVTAAWYEDAVTWTDAPDAGAYVERLFSGELAGDGEGAWTFYYDHVKADDQKYDCVFVSHDSRTEGFALCGKTGNSAVVRIVNDGDYAPSSCRKAMRSAILKIRKIISF